jgi:hypothetical protein
MSTNPCVDEQYLTVKQKEFIGSSRKTNKGVLTITGLLGKTKDNVALFMVHCSVCSKDKELFPDGSICITKAHFKEGNIPCGCGKYTRYSEYQYNIILNRKAKNLKVNFLGFTSEFNYSKTKILIGDTKSEDTYITTIHNFMQFEDSYIFENKINTSNNNINKRIGKSYINTKGNITTVISYRPSDNKYVCRCSLCSNDKELWPDGSIIGSAESIDKGRCFCACSNRPNWRNWQYLILIKRKIDPKGYSLLNEEDFKYENINRDSRVVLFNRKTNNTWSTSVSCIIHNNTGDVLEANELARVANLKSDDFHIKGFISAGFDSRTEFWRSNNKDYKGGSALWYYKCHVCGDICENYLGNLKRGVKSCSCYSIQGFDKSKPANFYIVRWYGYCESWIKCGITNRNVIHRINEQNNNSKHLDYEILYSFYNEDGSVIQSIEREYKQTFETSVCPKEYLPDGYTETTYDTEETIQGILALVNKYM